MLTLKELKKVVKVADMKADTPSAKALKESGAEIVVKEVLETDASIAVYENGYVLYQEGTKTTVFPLHKCSGYEYENADGTRKRVKRDRRLSRNYILFCSRGRPEISDRSKKELSGRYD